PKGHANSPAPATSKLLAAPVFSYSGIAGSDELRKCHADLEGERQKGIGVVLRTGEICQRAQKLLAKAGCDARFSDCLRYVGVDRTSAYCAIAVYRQLGDGGSGGQCAWKALSLRWGRKVPDDIRQQAKERASRGERITHSVAQNLIGCQTDETEPAEE